MEKKITENWGFLFFFDFILLASEKSCAKIQFIEIVVNTLTVQKTIKCDFRHKILF